MVDINSPLGRRAIATGAAQQKRILTVSDEDPARAQAFSPTFESTQNFQSFGSETQPFEPQNFESVQEFRKSAITSSRKITAEAKERIEILTGLGRCHDTVEVEGIIFSIQSLKGKEMRNIVVLSNGGSNASEAYFIARDWVLAYSIYEIDGQPISVVLGSNKIEDRVSFVENLDEHVIEHLHDRYLEMVKKNKTKFTIKNTNDAKEVAEDIKK